MSSRFPAARTARTARDARTAHPEDRSPREPGDRAQTQERLLDAAEALFAERGFEATSMRAITRAADASLSAVNYHFASKEGLLRATLMRRLAPINDARLARLDSLEGDPAAPPSLEAVIDAFLAPAFVVRAASPDARARYRQIAARLYSDPPELVNSLKRDLFQTVAERFLAALGRALPGRSRTEIALAWQFCVGVMVHVLAGHLESVPGAGDQLDVLRDEAVLAQMTAFVVAGILGSCSDPQGEAP